MNAAYISGLGTTATTVFLSATNSLGLTGFDVNTAEEIILTNHHASNILLVKVDGFHDDVSNSPQGYGALPTYNGWMGVHPGASIPVRVNERTQKIERVQVKALSGTVDFSFGVTRRH